MKDTSAVAQFKISATDVDNHCFFDKKIIIIFLAGQQPLDFTSNAALAVGAKIEYLLIKTINPYTHLPVNLILQRFIVKIFST